MVGTGICSATEVVAGEVSVVDGEVVSGAVVAGAVVVATGISMIVTGGDSNSPVESQLALNRTVASSPYRRLFTVTSAGR